MRVAEWRACTEAERNRRFSAFRVRTALDDRDGFKERKREAHYKLLCSFGAHATYEGFRLLRGTPSSGASIGPFFSEKTLGATLGELAKICAGATANLIGFLKAKSVADHEAELRLMEAHLAWLEPFASTTSKSQLVPPHR